MPPVNLLTKTDFKLARQCPTKLYYFRRQYPSTLAASEYLELLKEGGHIIGEISRIIHPGGIFIGLSEGYEKAAERTRSELEKDRVTLFEAVFVSNGMLAVADILEKNGKEINLIEVKSKSYDSSEENQIIGKKGQIKSEWQEYIEDVAFQKMIIQDACPEFSVTPYLLLPDKSKKTKIDGLASFFSIEKIQTKSSEVFTVNFTGDRKKITEDNFLTRVNISEACGFLMPYMKGEAQRFREIIDPELRKVQFHLGKHCKDCEFRSDLPETSGFHECWKELADVKPHMFDLYFGGALKEDGKFIFDTLAARGKASLYDIPEDLIKGKRGERQSIQISCSRDNREWIGRGLKDLLQSFRYPLHFIDFETSTSAVPYHRGMRPYEQLAFQWSCHTINEKGAEPVHSAWINLEDSFPSFKFAESLMANLSETGTIFMWAEHENIVLKEIRRQMQEYGHDNPDLARWIESVVVTEESPGRLVDMNRICLENYFHPIMKGRTSIKYVLPAVWNNNDYLWDIPFFRKYFSRGGDGQVLSPYESLPDIEIGGVKQVVKEGTGAMTAYQEMMYGLSKNNEQVKEQWSKLLLQYCELDTLAMVLIFVHWNRLCGINLY